METTLRFPGEDRAICLRHMAGILKNTVQYPARSSTRGAEP